MNKKIWIVDDDLAISYATKMILEENEFEVTIISNYTEFEDNITKNLPDLLLLDLKIGNIDGKEICKGLKLDDRTKNIPVILLSGNDNIESIAKECKANSFITKPFDIDYLEAKINQYI